VIVLARGCLIARVAAAWLQEQTSTHPLGQTLIVMSGVGLIGLQLEIIEARGSDVDNMIGDAYSLGLTVPTVRVKGRSGQLTILFSEEVGEKR
jgi:hypothetical protein